MRFLCVAVSLFLGSHVLPGLQFCRAADTIAVLPLFNIDQGKSPNLDWIGESASETVHEALSTSGLLVLPREDREEVYHRLSLRTGVVLTKASVIKIGETLDAGQVIYGTFHVDGGEAGTATVKSSLKISVHILDLKGFHEGFEFAEMGALENLSQMETRLSWRLLRQLAPERTPSEETFYHDRPPVRVDAMENYVRGLMASSEELKVKLFTQAAHLDEHFSQPAFQLGRMLFQRKNYKEAAPWLSKVSRPDSHFLDAAFLLGICKYYEADFDTAVDQLKMVSTEIPLNEVFNNLGAALSRKNDPSALEYFNKALEGDDSDPDYWFNTGYSLWKQGKFAMAADKFRAVLDRSAKDQEATIMLGRCLKQDGPRAGDPRSDGRERIKTAFEDSAFRQLQAELSSKH